MQQRQEGSYEERIVNTDPREQSSSGYESGYSQFEAESESWFREGEKLRPRAQKQGNGKSIITAILLVCVLLVVANVFGLILAWLSWFLIIGLVGAGVVLLLLNWRVITTPLPVERFAVQGHAQVMIDNFAGDVTIQRGDVNEVIINATQRTSGIGQKSNAWIESHQQANAITVVGKAHFSLFQFGFRTINMVVTVPQACDIQMKTGMGAVNVHDVQGNIKLRTGMGRIEANSLRGQIILSSGSGGMNVANLEGDISLKTGTGKINSQRTSGELRIKTGSQSIIVSDHAGRADLVTGAGEVQVLQSQLRGNTLVKTGSGSVTFTGTLDPLGTYNLRTGSGSIQASLASPVAFSLKASTGSGRVHNDFGGNEIGDGPRPRLTLKSGSGSIRINRIY